MVYVFVEKHQNLVYTCINLIFDMENNKVNTFYISINRNYPH